VELGRSGVKKRVKSTWLQTYRTGAFCGPSRRLTFNHNLRGRSCTGQNGATGEAVHVHFEGYGPEQERRCTLENNVFNGLGNSMMAVCKTLDHFQFFYVPEFGTNNTIKLFTPTKHRQHSDVNVTPPVMIEYNSFFFGRS